MINFPRLNEGDIVLVKWWDTLDSIEWRSQDSVKDWKLALVATVGIFLGIDKVKFKMAHSVTDEGETDGIVIHIAVIDYIEVLKRKK